jgi:hypothetical protein
METIVASHIIQFLKDEGLLSSGQFGFRRGHSTENELLLIYGDVVNWVDRGLIMHVIFLDFSKVLMLSHSVLLSKLGLLGFCDQLLSWIHSFLVGSQMRVSLSGTLSNFRDVLSGVPQSSVLGQI